MRFQARTNNERKLDVNWDRVNAYASKWKPGTVLDIEIVRRKRKISDPMRRLYFGHVLPAYGNHLGYDADEHMLLHRQLKIVWFNVQKDEKGIYRNVPHVFANEAETDVKGKSRFMEWVVRCAARDGCYIEMPGDAQ